MPGSSQVFRMPPPHRPEPRPPSVPPEPLTLPPSQPPPAAAGHAAHQACRRPSPRAPPPPHAVLLHTVPETVLAAARPSHATSQNPHQTRRSCLSLLPSRSAWAFSSCRRLTALHHRLPPLVSSLVTAAQLRQAVGRLPSPHLFLLLGRPRLHGHRPEHLCHRPAASVAAPPTKKASTDSASFFSTAHGHPPLLLLHRLLLLRLPPRLRHRPSSHGRTFVSPHSRGLPPITMQATARSGPSIDLRADPAIHKIWWY